jgi:hypothetical protein
MELQSVSNNRLSPDLPSRSFFPWGKIATRVLSPWPEHMSGRIHPGCSGGMGRLGLRGSFRKAGRDK